LLSLGLTYAETTLYGNVDQAWTRSTQKWATQDSTKGIVDSSTTKFESVQMGGGVLGVKGAEDLSGGMKALYTIEMQPAIDNASGADWNRQAFVGLSGGFGAVRIGKQYSNAFNNTVGVDPGGATGIAGNASYCVLLGYTQCQGGSDAPLRQSNGMQYDLPEMLPGLKAGLTMVLGEANTANGGAATGDGNGFNLSYASGPFSAGYTFDQVKNTGIGLLSNPTNKTQPNYDVAAASTADKNKLTTISASYNLGVAKISVNNAKMSVGSKSFDNTFVAVNVPVGHTQLWASMSSGSANRLSASGSVDKNHSGYQLGVNLPLSKRTIVYAQYGQMELEGSNKLELTGTAIGVHHSF
jgi:predicted porin